MNKRTYIKILSLLAFFVTSIGAQAAGLNVKPGLWEIQHKMDMDGQQMPDMQKMMANVPPEMREKMKAMMEKNGAGMTDKGMTVCVTPDQISRGDIGTRDPKNNNCKMTDMQHSGDKTTMKMHCDAPHAADSTTEVTRISDTQWKSMTHMTTEKGDMISESNGKWLNSDCGNVKPFSEMKSEYKKK